MSSGTLVRPVGDHRSGDESLKKSGRFMAAFAKPAKETKMPDGENTATVKGLVIPREWTLPLIVGLMLSGVGGPLLNNLRSSGVADERAAIDQATIQLTESTRLLTTANTELVKAIGALQKTVQKWSDQATALSERVERIERAESIRRAQP